MDFTTDFTLLKEDDLATQFVQLTNAHLDTLKRVDDQYADLLNATIGLDKYLTTRMHRFADPASPSLSTSPGGSSDADDETPSEAEETRQGCADAAQEALIAELEARHHFLSTAVRSKEMELDQLNTTGAVLEWELLRWLPPRSASSESPLHNPAPSQGGRTLSRPCDGEALLHHLSSRLFAPRSLAEQYATPAPLSALVAADGVVEDRIRHRETKLFSHAARTLQELRRAHDAATAADALATELAGLQKQIQQWQTVQDDEQTQLHTLEQRLQAAEQEEHTTHEEAAHALDAVSAAANTLAEIQAQCAQLLHEANEVDEVCELITQLPLMDACGQRLAGGVGLESGKNIKRSDSVGGSSENYQPSARFGRSVSMASAGSLGGAMEGAISMAFQRLATPLGSVVASGSSPDQTRLAAEAAVREPVMQLLSVREALLALNAAVFNFATDIAEVEAVVDDLRKDPRLAPTHPDVHQRRVALLTKAFTEAVAALPPQHGSDPSPPRTLPGFLTKAKRLCVLTNIFQTNMEVMTEAILRSPSQWREVHDMLAVVDQAKSSAKRRRSSAKSGGATSG